MKNALKTPKTLKKDNNLSMAKGGKTLAQTPAPKKDRIKGSKINKVGSAKDGKGIKLSNETINTLKNKLSSFKKENPNKTNITLNDLKAVYRRGSGAYSTSHRPTISGGAPNTRAAWSIARVNKFLKKASGDKVKKAYVQDDDLMEKGGKTLSSTEKLIDYLKNYGELKQGSESIGQDGTKYRYDRYTTKGESANNSVVFLFEKAAQENGKRYATQFNYNNKYSLAYDRPKYKGVSNGKIVMTELVEYDKMEKGGLIAPNGKKSNLTEEQYKLVRTPEFKAWFGDWENDPQNASKVVDENGEPMVVYHGTNVEFYQFDLKYFGKTDSGWYGKGFYFTPQKHFSFAKDTIEQYGGNEITLKVFLNIKNPLYGQAYAEQKSNLVGSAKDRDRDGVIIEYDYGHEKEGQIPEIIVWNPNQIKLADGTNTSFDSNSDDIRFENGGKMKNIIQQIGELVAPFQKQLAEQRIASLIKEGERVTKWDEEMIYLSLVYDLYSSIGNYLSNSDKLVGEIYFYEGNGGSIEISATIDRDGKEYKFRTEMIVAGGYNIQRRHYRYIVHTELRNNQRNIEAEAIDKEIKELKEKIKSEKKIEEYKKDIESYKNKIEEYKEEIEHNKKFTDEEIWDILTEEKNPNVGFYNLTYEELVEKNAPIIEMTKDRESFEKYRYEEFYLYGIKFWKKRNIEDLERSIRSYTDEIKKIEKKLQKAQVFENGGEIKNIEMELTKSLSVSDIDNKYPTLPHPFINQQLMKGIEVEMEHTDNHEVARKIALDHLYENPFYYEYLDKMEEELKNLDIDAHYNELMQGSYYAKGGETSGYEFTTPTKLESKLPYLQQVLVRTKAFKNWFGDWELAARLYLADGGKNFKKHYANVSKVVDMETLEPSLVFHGTSSEEEFYQFATNKDTGHGRPYGYFAINREYSMNFVGRGNLLYSAFLNIRNPFMARGEGYDNRKQDWAYWALTIANQLIVDTTEKEGIKLSDLSKEEASELAKKYLIIVTSQIEDYIRKVYKNEDYNFWLLMARDVDSEFKRFLISHGYDGILANEQFKDPYDVNNPKEYTNTCIIFDATQVKLADGRNLTFDPMNADIRYEKGGEMHQEEDLSHSKKERMRKMAFGGMYKSGGALHNDEGVKDDAKEGGLFVGRSHANGGIKAYNVSTNSPIEVEGGEVIITKKAVSDETKREFEGEMLTNKEILSRINESGGGVSFEDGGEIHSCGCSGKKFNYGGEVLEDYMIIKKMNELYDATMGKTISYADSLVNKLK